MSDRAKSSWVLKACLLILTTSFGLTYAWMYFQEGSHKAEILETPGLQVLESGYEREKASVEKFIADADRALADLDAQPQSQLWEPDLRTCYKVKYAPSEKPVPGEPLKPPEVISRDLDQECADKRYELAKNQALLRDKEVADKRQEIIDAKKDLEDHLNEIRSNFIAEKVHLTGEARRQIAKNSFATKFPIVFGLVLLLSLGGVFIYHNSR